MSKNANEFENKAEKYKLVAIPGFEGFLATGDFAAAAEIFRFVGLFSLADFGVLFCCLGEVCGELVDPLSSSPLPLPESTPESLPPPDAASPLGASRFGQ